MTDVRQSDQFSRFMHDIGWIVDRIDNTYIYLRKFPLKGYFAKMPRVKPPIPFRYLESLLKKYRIFKLKLSPFIISSNRQYNVFQKELLQHGFHIEQYPFNPTTTIRIDLTGSEQDIFQHFTEAKRRAVRRAMKNNISVRESSDIDAFISIRKKQYFPLGFLVVSEMKKLWQNFYPKNASLLLAFSATNRPVAGIFLLFYDGTAYYWYASAEKTGKKLFAPTLLVWEALKLARKKGCRVFDFEGIYDIRFPKAGQSWKGFTKFKQGFGGKEIVYLENYTT